MNDSIYIIYSGKCRVLINIHDEKCAQNIPEDIKEKYKYIVLDHLCKGQMLGEHSTVNKTPNPYTVEVCSETAIVF